MAAENTIWIDDDGAGHGWFVDRTPDRDEEYLIGNGDALNAIPNSEAASHIDLLTAIDHEFGHILGLDHGAASDLMADSLGPGVRRKLIFAEIDKIFADENWL